MYNKHPTDSTWISFDPVTHLSWMIDPTTRTFSEFDPTIHSFDLGKKSKLSIVGHGGHSPQGVQCTLSGETAISIGHLLKRGVTGVKLQPEVGLIAIIVCQIANPVDKKSLDVTFLKQLRTASGEVSVEITARSEDVGVNIERNLLPLTDVDISEKIVLQSDWNIDMIETKREGISFDKITGLEGLGPNQNPRVFDGEPKSGTGYKPEMKEDQSNLSKTFLQESKWVLVKKIFSLTNAK